MKRLLLIFLLSSLTGQNSYAQGNTLRLEGTFDFATGETKYAPLALTGSLSYHFQIFKGLYIGPLVGYRYSFGPVDDEEIRGVHPSFVPVAASADIRIFPSVPWISIGGDVGQAYSLNDEFQDGLFYRPRLGFEYLRSAQFVLSYSVIEPGEGINFTNWSFGLMFYL